MTCGALVGKALVFAYLVALFGVVVAVILQLARAGPAAVPYFFIVVALFGGVGLILAGVMWASDKYLEEPQAFFVRIVFYVVIMGGIVMLWDVPDIRHRPLAVVTLSDVAYNVLKFGALFVVGSVFVRDLRSL